jgi:ATP-dependent helicase Lhr and Lhr-like helicase
MPAHAPQRAQSDAQKTAALQLAQWFTQQEWTPAPFQRALWSHWLAGHSALLHAPTGTGKTLAAFGGALLEHLTYRQQQSQAADRTASRATPLGTLLWLTPMRALASDSAHSLSKVSRGLGLDLQIALRTSDTSNSERARQRKQLPDVLITTPESLSLLLSYADSSEKLARLHGVIVDEWHELLSSKRGVQLELGLARLRLLNPALRVLGLSATLGNLDQAHDVLIPPTPGAPQPRHIVHAAAEKSFDLHTLLPQQIERFPRSGHLGLQQLPRVVEQIFKAKSTLLFTNTRSQAELWHQALAAVLPDAATQLALHHGSLDRDVRQAVEARLKSGELRCAVATSSLDLGVDFSDVEQCIQLGSPKGIARMLQRAGRSGHAPGQRSILYFVPTNAFELLEIHATRQAIAARVVEPRYPIFLALDVLAQHMVTLAAGPGFSADALFAEIKGCFSFQDLSRDAFDRVLRFVQFGGDVLANYPEFSRVQLDADGVFRVPNKTIQLRHRFSIGTIVSDAMMQVRASSGASIGQVEESFIARLNPGDCFVFSGRVLELKRIHELTAYVAPSKSQRATVPRWMGGKFPLSTELADFMRRELGNMAHDPASLDAARAQQSYGAEVALLAPQLRLQLKQSALPAADEVLVERLQSKEGWHLFLYPFGGRQVNEGIAALMAHRASQIMRNSFSFAINDYGFELLAEKAYAQDEAALRQLLAPDAVVQDLLAAINAGELARRHFREIARIAGLLLQPPPGKVKSTRQLQASAGLLFDALQSHDPGHVLMQQAHVDVLQRQLNVQQMQKQLLTIQAQRLRIVDQSRLSPLAFPLWADRLRNSMSNESAAERIQRMAESLEKLGN